MKSFKKRLCMFVVVFYVWKIRFGFYRLVLAQCLVRNIVGKIQLTYVGERFHRGFLRHKIDHIKTDICNYFSKSSLKGRERSCWTCRQVDCTEDNVYIDLIDIDTTLYYYKGHKLAEGKGGVVENCYRLKLGGCLE